MKYITAVYNSTRSFWNLNVFCVLSDFNPLFFLKIFKNLKLEFRNRFANPIRNGEHIDASEYDVKLMKKRAFILHKSLDGVVQRKDYSYMCKHLPPKQEYVLSLRMTDVQLKLYEYYLTNKSIALDNSSGKVSGRGLFADFQTFLLVNNHPKALVIQSDNKEARVEREQVRDFVADSSSEDEFDENKLDEMDDKERIIKKSIIFQINFDQSVVFQINFSIK